MNNGVNSDPQLTVVKYRLSWDCGEFRVNELTTALPGHHFRSRQAAAFARVMRSLRSSTSMPITRPLLSRSSMIPGATSCVSTDLG
jgi:hypothetical protein